MKLAPDINTTKAEALKVLQETLGNCGELLEHEWGGRSTGTPSDPGYDLKLHFKTSKGQGRGHSWWVHAVIKSKVHPSHARQAIWDLQRNPPATSKGEGIYHLLIAPHISDSVAAMCEKEKIGHLDLSGNCNLEFGGLWIDRQGKERKYKEEQSQKSLYSPKASRLLRVLLRGPLRSYKVEELAAAARVSLGLVSKVRKVLLEQDLAEDSKEGIRIKGAVGAGTNLRDWLLVDDFPRRTEVREYSVLASDLTLAGNLVAFCAGYNSRADADPLFTQNFGAWLRAPHNVPTTVSAYLDEFPDEGELTGFLKARRVQAGAGNLRILVHADYEALKIGQQVASKASDFPIVSDLQLYLDLNGGETNGPEQAEVLRALENFSGGWS